MYFRVWQSETRSLCLFRFEKMQHEFAAVQHDNSMFTSAARTTVTDSARAHSWISFYVLTYLLTWFVDFAAT